MNHLESVGLNKWSIRDDTQPSLNRSCWKAERLDMDRLRQWAIRMIIMGEGCCCDGQR